jgi:hypothetical protein
MVNFYDNTGEAEACTVLYDLLSEKNWVPSKFRIETECAQHGQQNLHRKIHVKTHYICREIKAKPNTNVKLGSNIRRE